MSEMLKIFLQTIPSILFEAIAVAGLIGVLLAAVFYAKRPFGKFYWLISGMIIYMLIWRILIQIISSRYAEILLYPAVIASVYACFKVPEMIEPFIKKYIPQKIWRLLPLALVGGLCIACFCKVMRINPYDPIVSAAKIIRQDQTSMQTDKVLILSEARSIQLRYYTKLPAKKCPVLFRSDNSPDEKKIRGCIWTNRHGKDFIYIAHIEKANQPPIQLKVKKNPDPRWKFLGQEYIDRRQKKVLRVYRYTVNMKYKKPAK